ncbi:hypothetical protein [Massilia sp. Leaf139]|uniref:hypothetical protein n=1 Tax=Massilia sp. Leaf139 TaxID=1736272 RepID=UPI0006F8288D|nr:hypothetical protein [Massilia sp. Leaf139]KQQ94971.1 hypothetical protein ASF77_22240 [Massilia sp. Leaf139]
MGTKHTPTPWRVTDGTNIKDDCRPISEHGVLIAGAHGYNGSGFFPSDEEAAANATFIVRACNAHEELVKALRVIKTQSIGDDWTAEQAMAFVKQHAADALAAVEAP